MGEVIHEQQKGGGAEICFELFILFLLSQVVG